MPLKNLAITPQSNNGFSMIEVLVTMLILSISLLGLAAMQNTSMRIAYDSYLRTQATFITYDLVDRIRANPDVSDPYQLTHTGSTSEKDCFSADCSPSDLQQHDLYYWKQQAQELLPDANFALAFDQSKNIYSISISWEDRQADANADGDSDTRQQFNYSFKITD